MTLLLSFPGNYTKKNTKRYDKWKKNKYLFATYYMIGFKPNSVFDGNLSYTIGNNSVIGSKYLKKNFVDIMIIKTVFNIIR